MELHRENVVTAEDVVTLGRVTGLTLDPQRVEELAGLLAAALEANALASAAASSVDVAEALSFDPGWTGQGSGS